MMRAPYAADSRLCMKFSGKNTMINALLLTLIVIALRGAVFQVTPALALGSAWLLSGVIAALSVHFDPGPCRIRKNEP